MPDEARDGRNVALNLTSVRGVLDCPKKNQAITYPACLITSTKDEVHVIILYCKQTVCNSSFHIKPYQAS